MPETILSWIGQLVLYGGGTTAIAFAAFRLFSERWLQTRFDKNLEAFRHENAKELQSLRAEIDGALSTRLRIQEKEFEILASCWDLMNIAFGATQRYVSPFQQYPDINRMPEEAKKEYLDSEDFYEFQKIEVLQSARPNEELHRLIDLRRRNKAAEAHAEFHNELNRNEIYLSEEVLADFRAVADRVKHAIIKKEISKEGRDFKIGREAWDDLEKECAPIVEQISKTLRVYMRASIATEN